MLKQLLNSFRDLLFPPLCLHCRNTISEMTTYLCAECSQKLQLISPQERCPLCFSSEYQLEYKQCPACNLKPSALQAMAAAFDYVGPPASIIRKFKYGNQPYLADGIGAYLVAQFLQLKWPLPDYIIPVPISFTHWLERGYNQSELIGQHIAELLGKPLITPIIRKSGDYSQAGMSRQQRAALTTSTFQLKNASVLSDKVVLLIDDVITTGSTLKRCADVLAEGYPAEIYALSFCRAIKS
ncbi:MAG: ComF family protein [Parachlamydiaceae bacterium]